jgi:glutathione S-transferase
MLLIGMFDSPYVRRVAVSLKLLGMSFTHADWSVGRDFERIRQYNPLGRVPTLVLDDGEVLMESAAILDHLDEKVGPERALLPAGGGERRTALRLMAIATGAADKTIAQLYESAFRPPEKRHEPWLARCRAQTHGALAELERYLQARRNDEQEVPWLIAERMTQADITCACVFTFISEALQLTPAAAPYPALRAHAARCETLPQFRETKLAFVAPRG